MAPQPTRGEPAYRAIPDADALERILNELPARPFLVGEDGVSMSLAGAQEKLPVAVIDGRIAVPTNGAPSTHILKPDNPRLPGSVQNEALCMVLARRIGLNVAPWRPALLAGAAICWSSVMTGRAPASCSPPASGGFLSGAGPGACRQV
jgi:hypothetical protein